MIPKSTNHPYLVGNYQDKDGQHFHAMGVTEMGRLIRFYSEVFATHNAPTRSTILLITYFEDATMSLPIEQYFLAHNYIPAYAEATPFDVARVEAFIRRLDMKYVFGVNADVLNGLEQFGHDAEKLLAGRTVWARGEDAYQRLAKMSGFTLHRWMEIGPMLAMECVHGGGLHYDDDEWLLDQVDGEIIVSSKLQRAQGFENIRTGIKANIDTSVCTCGCGSSRIVPIS